MAWPTPQGYSEAVQNPKLAFSEDDLRGGRPELDKLGLPRPRSGSFATVYKILSIQHNWAVKCFLNPVSDQQERYSEISAHLHKVNLPYLVQFRFLSQGIKVDRQIYPILKMEWVEGESLITYVEKNRGNPAAILSLARRWIEMTTALTRASIAHGDLQHGNVLIVNGDIRLVDYDGMYVPGLIGRGSPEKGQRNYQHPQRTEFDFGPNLDNFSSWVIYVSLVATAVQSELWQQFRGGDDCLLFRQSDFEHPEKSALFVALEKSSDDRIRSIAGFFRSLLDLGPQDVPTLDGQTVPPPSARAASVSTNSWISDYVRQSAGPALPSGATTPGMAEPSPSWIQDFVAPGSSATPERKFETPTMLERTMLGLSLLTAALFIVLCYLGFASLLTAALTILGAVVCNIAVWYYRFRLDPTVMALRAVEDDLKGVERKIDMVRMAIKSKEADRKSVLERHSFEQSKLTKELEVAKRAEQNEMSAAQATFQLEMSGIGTRRRDLTQQETSALQKLSDTLGAQVNDLTRQIANSNQAEASEISTALASQQAQFITNYLRGWHIDDASIAGIGPGYKSRLRMAGILSAADVDNRVYGVKGIGQAKAGALFAWQQPLKNAAQQKMPKSLSAAEMATISGKRLPKRQVLVAQKEHLDQQQKNAEAAVRAQYKSLREPLNSEELLAKRRLQSAEGPIQTKYRERYLSAEGIRKKLDDELKRNLAELDEKSNKERRNLFAVHWELEKFRRKTIPFKRIRFSSYAKRVVGLGR